MSEKGKFVDLGFAEKCENSWLLTNRFFPSKIGGFPAWLELSSIPNSEILKCEYCSESCIFLCQVYAGSEHIAHAFHRTIYIFICRNEACCKPNQSGNIKVLRNQLPLKNGFYSETPPDESVFGEPIKERVKLCKTCGIRGDLVCSKCKNESYCGKLHQKIDWKSHKKICSSQSLSQREWLTESTLLFPEFGISIEREMLHETRDVNEIDVEKEKCEANRFNALGEITDKDLENIPETKEDKTFGKFKKAIDVFPHQVLRYNRHAEPLWISDFNFFKTENVPKCSNCNAERSFEFQAMPQMLNELKIYDLDWGVLAIYTCRNDCYINGNYVTEFCYKQDIIKQDEGDALRYIRNEKESSQKKEESVQEKLDSLKISMKKVTKKCDNAKNVFMENDVWE